MTDTAVPSPTPAASRRLTLVGLALVLAVGAFAVTVYVRRSAAVAAERDERQRAVDAGLPVLVAKAHVSPGTRMVTLPGDVRAFRQVTLYAKVSGYLRTINVDKGDRVKGGAIIGVVQSPETDQQALSLRADLAVKKQVQARYRSLVGRGVVSQQEMDRADADAEAAEAELARVEALKDYEIIRAPYDGVVTARYVDPGALMPAATGATQSAQPLVDVADMSVVRIFVYVGQMEAPYVHERDNVEITGDDLATGTITAPVTRISRALDPRTRTMLAEIDLDNRQGLLYPGLFVHVALSIKAPAGLTIPADSVVLRAGQPQVALIDANHARFVPVRLGDDDGQTVRVISGIKEGDLVGLHVGDEVSEGVAVQPVFK